MAGVVGLREVRYGYEGKNHIKATKDESNPYFTYDPSKCIVCSRCVRACEELQGTFALTIGARGFESRVVAGMQETFLDSECVSCGACIQACPTATLVGKIHHRNGPARSQHDYNLRLLRRRLFVPRRNARQSRGSHGAE